VKREEIINKIESLKIKKNAIILAHNYQLGEVQDAADFLGDSLDLSRKAAELKEDIILFCGVRFMAETAAILSPKKTVLIPDGNAGCPLADWITASQLKEWKKRYPGRKVVCYVNSSTEVKAECDVCCTSANALKVVDSIDEKEILFVPDKNLASYVASQTEKKIIPWNGYCYVHDNIRAEHINEKKALHARAEIWVHPECRPEVISLADRVFSTGQMIREAKKTKKKEIIIGTETGIIYRLSKENPGKKFYPAKDTAICSDMKKINLEKILESLEEMKFKVEVPFEIAQGARRALERMVKID